MSTRTRSDMADLNPSPSKRARGAVDGSKVPVNVEEQKEQVRGLIKASKTFSDEVVDHITEWFYGKLGLHEFYFQSHTPQEIAHHIQGLQGAPRARSWLLVLRVPG